MWVISLLLGLIFLGFFLQGYFNLKLAKEQKIDTEILQKQVLAETMTDIAGFPVDFDTLKHRLDELKQIPGMENVAYLRIIKPDGDIFCSTLNQEIGKKIENFQIPDGTVISDDTFQDNPIKTVTTYSGLYDTIVQLGFSIQGIANNRQDIIIFLVSDILFFFLLAVCFFILFKIIIKPLKELTELCGEMSKGRLITKPIESDIQEISHLTAAFNIMLANLKTQSGEIEKANENLEIKVGERTKELENLTAKLEEKVTDRTKELQEKLKELEKFQNLAIGRELKMIEMKKEIEKLKKQTEGRIGI